MNFDEATVEELKIKILQLEIENNDLKNHTNTELGLTWENKPDVNVLKVKDCIPVLTSNKSKNIEENKDSPTHLLIKGDNFPALITLLPSYKNGIDAIYIDPPYNTGNQDFVYNDKYIDKNDRFTHSKWLSFMKPRLKLAQKMLAPSGVIFISIDDNEQSHLKLLMDSIFGEQNFVALLPVVNNLKGNNDQKGFAGTHEYCLVYSKNIQAMQLKGIPLTEEQRAEYSLRDEKGYYKKGANLVSTGANAPRSKRPNLFYSIFFNEKMQTISPVRESELDIELIPKDASQNEMSWRWGSPKMFNSRNEIIISKQKNGKIDIFKKQRLEDFSAPKPKSIFIKPSYSGTTSSNELKSILSNAFSYSKSRFLIQDLISMIPAKNAIILDFFAGSGTSGHAVAQLNSEDGGTRKCILITDSGKAEYDENGNQSGIDIANDITYERMKRVLTGKNWADGKEHPSLGQNLEVYNVENILVRNREAISWNDDEEETEWVETYRDIEDVLEEIMSKMQIDKENAKAVYALWKEAEKGIK